MTAQSLLVSTATLLALCFGCCGAVRADSVPGVAMGKDLPIVEKIDKTHEKQARFFGQLVDKIDRVFGEPYQEDRQHKVQVRAGGETTFNDQGESTDTALVGAVRLPLPALERKLNLFLDIGGDINELGAASNPSFADSDSSLSLAAGLIRRYRDNLEGGLKLNLFRSSGSLLSVYPFVRFEQRRDTLRYFFEQRLVWESDGSWSTRIDFDIDRTLRRDFFLRFRNRADYTFGTRGTPVAHALILRQSVFSRSGLSWEVWMEYNTAGNDPETFEDDAIAYAQVRWRGRVWRDWLEYEFRPAYTVVLENGRRDPFFSFLVSLTVVWDSYLGGSNDAPAGGARQD